jgi:hypothetical protein
VLTALTRLAQVCKIGNTEEKLIQRAYYDLNPVGKTHWTNTLFGDLRDPISRQPITDPDDYVRIVMNPSDNAENLDPAYLASLANLPERQRKRFFEGVYVDELESALWSYEGLERGRVENLPPERRRRVVVAVDPSGARNESDTGRDEIGIVVAALGIDGHGYILADRSLRDAPAVWAKAVIKAYHDYGADCIIAEVNFGGAMVEATIKGADANVPVRVITASRGKVQRAEPVSALYGEGPEFKDLKVHHVGRFPVLEDQLVAFTTFGYRGEGSPDHADACIWALTDLMLGSNAEAWIRFYQEQASTSQAAAAAPANQTDRPVPEKTAPTPIDNAVIAAYARITGATMKKPTCAWCGEEVGGTKTTDGEDDYHEGCYHQYLRAGSKPAPRAEAPTT